MTLSPSREPSTSSSGDTGFDEAKYRARIRELEAEGVHPDIAEQTAWIEQNGNPDLIEEE